jgi:cell division protein FtsB
VSQIAKNVHISESLYADPAKRHGKKWKEEKIKRKDILIVFIIVSLFLFATIANVGAGGKLIKNEERKGY